MSACSAALAATVEERGEEGEVTLAFDFGVRALDEAIARSAPCRFRLTSPRAGAPTSGPQSTIRRCSRARRGRSPRRPQGCISRPGSFEALEARGCHGHFVTLHVGPGTFLPVRSADTGGSRHA